MEERTAQITLTESEAEEIMCGLYNTDDRLDKPDAKNAAMIAKWKQFMRDNFDPHYGEY